MTKREAAQWYRERYHWHPVEVEPATKKPVRDNWTQPVLEPDLNGFFEDDSLNIGVLLGDPYNLTDVDIDSPEAWWAMVEYAIPTSLKFGHRSKPASHCFYYSDPAARTAKYNDPAPGPGQQACLIELRCQTRDGKVGFQTVVPPSIHSSGEPIEFTPGGGGFPSNVEKEELERAVRLAAAAALLGRHLVKGKYHEAFIALAGALARAKWALPDAQKFLRALYRVIWHDKADLYQAEQDADSTYRSFDDGRDTTGLRTLASFLEPDVFRAFTRWMSLDAHEHQQAAPERAPRVLPQAFPIDELRTREIAMPRTIIEGLIQSPGIMLLVAPGKVGKTVLGVEIAMSIANGLHLFNNYVTQKTAGLIVEWDDQRGEASMKDFVLKCRASRPGQELRIVFQPAEPLTISDPEFRPWLVEQIRAAKAGFVLLDSYTALRGFGSDDRTRNVVKLEASEILLLGQIAIETNCVILLIHHDSKSAAANLDIFSRAAGTFALQACSEAQIVMNRFPELAVNDPARLISVRGRHLEGLQAVLRFQRETLDFDFILDGPIATYYPELCTVLHGFRARSFEAKEAKEHTGWGHTKTYQVLGQLTGAGILNRNSGSWDWNPAWNKILEQI